MHFKAITRNVGYALLVSALFMFLSILVSVFEGNDSALAALIISFTLTFSVGIFPFIFVRKTEAITMKDGYLIIVLSWLLSFIFGMLPYVLYGGQFTLINAWYESVSGFTTTGATCLADIEALPNSLLFWRASTHFIGGLGVVVFLVLIIPSSSQMRLRLTNMELTPLSKSGYHSKGNSAIKKFAIVYFAILAASFTCYVILGMKPIDAICHAMSVTATGGFSTKNMSIGFYHSVPIDIATMFFMLLSATHFGTVFMVFATRSLQPLKNEIFKYFMISVFTASFIVSLSLKLYGVESTWGQSFLSGTFHVISYSTTCGFGIADNSAWPALPSAVLMFVGIWCGMAGSTSGGVKLDREVLLFKEIRYQLNKSISPSSIYEVRVNRRMMSQSEVAPHILYIAMFLLVFIISVSLNLVLSKNGNHALYATLTALSNVGPAIGDLGTYGSFYAEPAGAKFLYSVDMFLGRVEIYPIFAVVMMIFNPQNK